MIQTTTLKLRENGNEIFVDTSVGLQRRKSEENKTSEIATLLMELIEEQCVDIINSIRQELLSGIRVKQHYLALRDKLRNFTEIALMPKDFERAAENV